MVTSMDRNPLIPFHFYEIVGGVAVLAVVAVIVVVLVAVVARRRSRDK